jgi:hypothetical protein
MPHFKKHSADGGNFLSIFGDEYNTANPNGKLANLFAAIEVI